MKYSNNEFQAEILEQDGVYLLLWNDRVANVWQEYFDNLATAVLRLGLLIESVKLGRGFNDSPDVFARYAEGFYSQHLIEEGGE